MKLLAVLLPVLALQAAAAPDGIPRDLAQQRAALVSNVHYGLRFELAPHADAVRGHEVLSFELKDNAAPLLLDFREGAIQRLTVNGVAGPTTLDHGHIVLPRELLSKGTNKVEIGFSAPAGAAGKAITRYQDKDDGSEYVYTLFVPMDASMAFPCFDQPDLKARFRLTLEHPADWQTISNVRPGEETEPISTYLFAFAAGPFQKVNSTPGLPDVFVRRSQVARAREEVPEIQQLTARGTAYLAEYFRQRFPFSKYDMVLLPGFPFGGMEHAGVTFLNEDSMLFRTAPTESDRFGRNITVLHELTHQWFGDFTTMRWFDDLWLKEGFAQYMAYHAMAELTPEIDTWARFYQQIKPAAYGIDITAGTTPIYQNIPNLKDAKSAYGAIVYSKAPGLLRQLEFLLGAEKFRDGLRLYLAAHRYGNAQWDDLVHAFEQASGKGLKAWADAWIKQRGLPVITTDWSCSGSKLEALTLRQRDVLGEGRTWPVSTEVMLGYTSAPPITFRAQLTGATQIIAAAAGSACPSFVFANDDDHAYGLFLPDAKSVAFLVRNVRYQKDLFTRSLLWGALYDSMHFAALDPHAFVQTAISALPSENDEFLMRSLTGRTLGALHEYLDDRNLLHDFELLAFRRMKNAEEPGARIIWFRTFVAAALSPDSLTGLRSLLRGSELVPGVEFRPLDRWRMVTSLLANSDPEALSFFEAEKQKDASGIARKYAYIAVAARRSKANKSFYFDDYLNNGERPEDWVQDSLSSFNQWNQTEVTLPYLRPALNALPQIKQQRKIFFLTAWLSSFIGGQNSSEASATVHDWLGITSLEPDLRLKVLQVLDELDRTVKIRAEFTTSSH